MTSEALAGPDVIDAPGPWWRGRLWLAPILVAIVALGIYFLPALGLRGQAVVYVGADWGAALVVVAALRLNRPARPIAWMLVAIGIACIAIGDALWYVPLLAGEEMPYPSLADAFYLAEYPFLLAGAIGLVRGRPNRGMVLDSLLVSIGAATVIWEFLVRPSIGDPGDALLGTLVTAAYPVADIAIVGVIAGIVFSTGLSSTSLRLLSAGFLMTLVADLLYLWMSLVGTVPDPTPLDAAWLLTLGLWAAAALHPSARQAAAVGQTGSRHAQVAQMAVLMAASVLVPLTLLAKLPDEDLELPTLVGAWVLMAVLVAYRVSGIMTELRGSEGRLRTAAVTLRKSEQRYRELFDSNPQPMWVYDLETLRFLAVNDLAVSLYGWSRAEFLAMTIADIRPPSELPALLDNLAGSRQLVESTGPWRHRRKDGSEIAVEITSHSLTWEGRDARLVLAFDVTHRIALEQQLRQAQKMEAIGRLAGGVAHDFNNLLTAISGYAEILREDVGDAGPSGTAVNEILRAGDRAAGLTRQLLAFSRRQVLKPQVLDLSAAVRDDRSMLARLIGEDVDVQLHLEEALVPVSVDPVQVTQILMNLAGNARDALPDGGTLTVQTANVVLDEDAVHDHPGTRPGPHAMLAVSDTGDGMDEETLRHVFEPFFTTKPVGEGTGLGLATVYGIVQQSGGSIWAYSEPGMGATFKIYFPAAGVGIEAKAVIAARAVAVAAGTETILVVEDEEAVRSLVTRLLERAGYRVLVAPSPDLGEALAASYPGSIDLLLSDVVMPGRNGPALAERVRATRPGIRTVFMSGYTEDVIIHRGVLEGGMAFVGKPFSAEELLGKVREVLDGPDGRSAGRT